MKRFTVEVPENQVSFFTQLLQNLRFEVLENKEEILSEEQHKRLNHSISQIENGEAMNMSEFKKRTET
ncbi:MAG: hypothetical protein ACI85I_000927 [Arenicella sp.]|jgi:hypothetical protein